MQIYRNSMLISCVDNWCSHFPHWFVWFVISGVYVPCRFVSVQPDWMAVSVCTIYAYSAIIKNERVCVCVYSQQLPKALLSIFPFKYLSIYLRFVSSVCAYTQRHKKNDHLLLCANSVRFIANRRRTRMHQIEYRWWWEENEYRSHGNKRADTPIVFETSILRVNTNESIQSPANFTSLCLPCITIMLGTHTRIYYLLFVRSVWYGCSLPLCTYMRCVCACCFFFSKIVLHVNRAHFHLHYA